MHIKHTDETIKGNQTTSIVHLFAEAKTNSATTQELLVTKSTPMSNMKSTI